MKKSRGRAEKRPEELPGARKKSFLLPFAGGEIWFEHLDGMDRYTELAVQKLRADAAIFRRPSSSGYIAFVLDETRITDELISEVAGALLMPGKQFARAAFVGTDRPACRKLKRLLSGHGFALGFLRALSWQRSGSWVGKASEGSFVAEQVLGKRSRRQLCEAAFPGCGKNRLAGRPAACMPR